MYRDKAAVSIILRDRAGIITRAANVLAEGETMEIEYSLPNYAGSLFISWTVEKIIPGERDIPAECTADCRCNEADGELTDGDFSDDDN